MITLNEVSDVIKSVIMEGRMAGTWFGGEGNGEFLFNVYSRSFLQDEKLLEICCART